jgi:hypothetical protein
MLARARRLTALLPAALALAAGLAAPADARIIEVGQVGSQATPSCPASPCLAVSRTTGYQAKIGRQRNPFVVPEDGRLVAWSVTLGKPRPRQIAFFEDMLGGPAAARITVLRAGDRFYRRVTGQSPVRRLEPYFGTTVQFPLGRSLTVRKGYLVALTVPTWAPALAVGLPEETSWRASRRPQRCADTQRQSVQARLGALAQYRCLYRTARLTYSATIVTSPKPAGR